MSTRDRLYSEVRARFIVYATAMSRNLPATARDQIVTTIKSELRRICTPELYRVLEDGGFSIYNHGLRHELRQEFYGEAYPLLQTLRSTNILWSITDCNDELFFKIVGKLRNKKVASLVMDIREFFGPAYVTGELEVMKFSLFKHRLKRLAELHEITLPDHLLAQL